MLVILLVGIAVVVWAESTDEATSQLVMLSMRWTAPAMLALLSQPPDHESQKLRRCRPPGRVTRFTLVRNRNGETQGTWWHRTGVDACSARGGRLATLPQIRDYLRDPQKDRLPAGYYLTPTTPVVVSPHVTLRHISEQELGAWPYSFFMLCAQANSLPD